MKKGLLMTRLPTKLLVLLFGMVPASAMGHVVFSEQQAVPGGYYTGFLRVGHGCGNSPTAALRVSIPEGVISAKPQPKPGWTLRIDKVPLTKPVLGEGGAQITERVAAITWTGVLPVDQFDQFGLSLKLPGTTGPLYFPTVQRCETGENAWTTIPHSPEQWHQETRPAPMLMLEPREPVQHAGSMKPGEAKPSDDPLEHAGH
jgi:uncharacterized protein YcnI